MRYDVIYADPPWEYYNYNHSKAKRGQLKEYPLMTLDEICQMPVKNISSKNCILFLWATWPYLPESIQVIKSWGFEYYSIGFIWIKTNSKSGTVFWGMGNYTRSNSEPCLIGIKGKPKRISASVHSVIHHPRSKHSTKPDIIRDKIVELMGDVPKIELFARQEVDGWSNFGIDTGNLILE